MFIPLLAIQSSFAEVQSYRTFTIETDGSIIPATQLISRIDDVYSLAGNIMGNIVVEANNIKINGEGYMLQGNNCFSDRRCCCRNVGLFSKTQGREVMDKQTFMVATALSIILVSLAAGTQRVELAEANFIPTSASYKHLQLI